MLRTCLLLRNYSHHRNIERNALLYGSDACLVEINPEVDATRRITWKDFDLVESSALSPAGQRRSTTWAQFNNLANRLQTFCSAAA